MATSRRVGNYASSANAVIRNSDAIFDAAMSGKPDFTKISKEAIKGRSLERRAVTKAEADVASAGLEAFTKTNLTRMREDTKKEIADIKRPAKRMAGIVGGLGAIAGGYVMMEGNKRDKADRETLKAERDKLNDITISNYKKTQAENEALVDWVRGGRKGPIPGIEALEGGGSSLTSDPKPSTPAPVSSGDSTPAPSGASSITKPSTPASTKPTKLSSAKPGSPFKKIYDLAVEVGGTKFPEIVAAQAMHETGHLNTGIKSVYNSTGGTNPFGQTGDRGYGTIPREGFKDGWTLYPDMKTAVQDHIKLWHDTGNHGGNYNAFNTRREGIASVTPSYSPNADPANIRKGYTEDAYSSSMKKILEANGFSF